MTEFKLREIAARVGGEVKGDPDYIIRGVGGIEDADEGRITFLADERFARHLANSRAGAVTAAKPAKGYDGHYILSEHPYYTFSKIIRLFHPVEKPEPGIHPSVILGKNVKTGKGVRIAPQTVIGDDVELGDRVCILSACVLGNRVKIGEDSYIHPNSAILNDVFIGKRVIIHSGTVVGSDGYGFIKKEGKHHKIPHIGTVVIEDDVELGACVTIDRGVLGETRIKRGVKTDNHVHIGHNVSVGEDGLLVAMVGISGSVAVGDRVTVAGQAGLAGHIRIGDDVTVTAKAGVTKNIPSKSVMSGFPAMPHRDWQKMTLAMQKLPELREKIKELEEKLKILEKDSTQR